MKKQRFSGKKTAGRYAVKSLFESGELNLQEFHDVFIQEEDMTEYRPAMRLLGSWEDWKRIKNNWPGFNDHLNAWKEELEIKLQSEALSKILSLRNSESDAQALTASKFIAEAGWNKRAGAGRPSNAEKKRLEKEVTSAAQITKEEKERVLKVINFDRS